MSIAPRLKRLFSSAAESTAARQRKVAVLGAAGGIGQPLSLLLKTASASSIGHLALYDIANMGMAADLAHICTAPRITAHSGEAELANALRDAAVVLIPAGVPRKPGMTRDDLFATNATIVRNLAAACARHAPQAHILVISNPVNSTVPIAAETMRAMGVANPSLFGVTTLDLVRARTFIAEAWGLSDPQCISVPVIGGHSGPTIVPLLSQAMDRAAGRAPRAFTADEVEKLVKRIQYGGDEVVQAKAGAGSATLSMAYAAHVFFSDLCRALDGSARIRQTAFIHAGDTHVQGVRGTNMPAPYFAAEVELGPNGLASILPLPQPANAAEQQLLQVAVDTLNKDIQKGIDFARSFDSRKSVTK
jgi:malate dehydrogenase